MHRAIKHAMAATTTLAVTVSANADLIGLDQELVDPVAEGWTKLGYDDEALVTYRIYAWFDSDEVSVTAVGDVGGDDRELSLGPGPFFNSALGSDFAPNPNFTGVAPDTLWDTFVTIGEEVAQGASGLPNTSGAPGLTQQADGLTGCVTLDDTGWFVSSFPGHANAVDGRVLPAQLTVPRFTQV